jgi:RNase H-fold protein (predicted Holliday junction resolvase)
LKRKRKPVPKDTRKHKIAEFMIGKPLADRYYPEDKRTPHRKFEDHVEKYLNRKYGSEYEVKPQHPSKTGLSTKEMLNRKNKKK